MLGTEQTRGIPAMEVFRAIGLYPTFCAKGRADIRGVSFAFISFALRGGFFLLRIVALSSVYIDRLVTIVKIIARRELNVLI